MQNLCAYEVRHFFLELQDSVTHLCSLPCFEYRLSLWVTPASAPCSRKMNGCNLIIREPSLPRTEAKSFSTVQTIPLLRLDLNFWYGSGFGSPVGRAQGIGYVQELVARLTKTPISLVRCEPPPPLSLSSLLLIAPIFLQYNSTTNSTLDNNPTTFPLDGRALYVDATHEVTIINSKPFIPSMQSSQVLTFVAPSIDRA